MRIYKYIAFMIIKVNITDMCDKWYITFLYNYVTTECVAVFWYHSKSQQNTENFTVEEGPIVYTEIRNKIQWSRPSRTQYKEVVEVLGHNLVYVVNFHLCLILREEALLSNYHKGICIVQKVHFSE